MLNGFTRPLFTFIPRTLGCRNHPACFSSKTDPCSTLSISTVENFVPGPHQPSTWWPPIPKSGKRVVRLYPIRYRHKPHIVLVREGCVNRPFFTIQIKSNLSESKQQGIEQVGSWDPFPNQNGEQLVALNLERICYWLGRGAEPSTRVAELLGLSGLLPIHPRSYLVAHRSRIATTEYLEKLKEQQTGGGDSKQISDSENSDVLAESKEPDPKLRPDAVWRRGNEPSWWWYHGLK